MEAQPTSDTPAARVIAKCGGHEAVARMANVHVTRVFRWTYPKERGGTDGLIPHRHQQKLLDAARQSGIALEPADFFAVAQDATNTPSEAA